MRNSSLPDPPETVLKAARPCPQALERLLGCWAPCVAAQGHTLGTRVGASSGATLPVSGTVLLHGREGVGKFTLVARAAATLGLHLVAVEGAELALKGLREAEDSLRDTANAAAAAAPVGEW